MDIAEKICRTATSLFVKKGVRDVNIDEICHALNLSKKTFYQYYKSKEDLVGKVIDAHLESIKKDVNAQLDGKTPIEIFSYILNHRNKGNGSAVFNRKVGEDIDKYYHETFEAHTKKVSKMMKESFKSFFEDGVGTGVFRSDLDIRAASLLFVMLHKSMLRYLDGEYITDGRRLSARTLDKAFKDMVSHTILSEKGWELYNQIRAAKND